jgi:subtilisin family serine protease
LLSLALLATSCSRSLPTAPETQVVRDAGADAFATSGLENQVAITLAPGVSLASLATEYGAVVVSSEPGEFTAALRPVAGQTAGVLMEQLTIDGRIVTAEPNTWLETAEARQSSFAFDDGFGSAQTFAEQPAAAAIRLDAARKVATGRGVLVAIIDSGVDLTHPMLSPSIVGGWDFVDNDAIAADQPDFIDNDRDGRVDEAFGHGTHVAGIVHLIAPNAQLLIVRVLDADGRGDIVNVAAGVRWALDHGAKVINLSLGAARRSDALQNVLEEAENTGVIVLTAAGNWGTSALVDFPGKSTHTACIAAVDANGAGASFSSYGSEVELSAPGIGIRSTYPGGGYRLWTGTSMSAPFVAGAAALLAELHPLWTLLDMELRLQTTARVIDTVPVGASARQFGAGMLDVGAALAPDYVPELGETPAPVENRLRRPR